MEKLEKPFTNAEIESAFNVDRGRGQLAEIADLKARLAAVTQKHDEYLRVLRAIGTGVHNVQVVHYWDLRRIIEEHGEFAGDFSDFAVVHEAIRLVTR